MIWTQTQIEQPEYPFIITPSGILVEIIGSKHYDTHPVCRFSDENRKPICQVMEGNVVIFQPDKVKLSTHENAN